MGIALKLTENKNGNIIKVLAFTGICGIRQKNKKFKKTITLFIRSSIIFSNTLGNQ